MKDVWKICFVCLMSFCLCGCTLSRTQKEELPKLVIGGTNYSPYFFQNMDGKYEGIDVDIAAEACKRMGYAPVFQEVELEERFQLLEEGKVDCLWSCLNIESSEAVLWTEPYLYTQRVVVVPESSKMQTLEDLKGKKVAVLSGSSSENIVINGLNPNFPEIKQLVSYNSLENAFMAMRKNYVDAVIGHESSMMVYTEEYENQYRYLHVSLRSEALGVAFAKEKDSAVMEKMNHVIEEMREDGTMKAIIQKYGLDVEKNLNGGINNEKAEEKQGMGN